MRLRKCEGLVSCNTREAAYEVSDNYISVCHIPALSPPPAYTQLLTVIVDVCCAEQANAPVSTQTGQDMKV